MFVPEPVWLHERMWAYKASKFPNTAPAGYFLGNVGKGEIGTTWPHAVRGMYPLPHKQWKQTINY